MVPASRTGLACAALVALAAATGCDRRAPARHVMVSGELRGTAIATPVADNRLAKADGAGPVNPVAAATAAAPPAKAPSKAPPKPPAGKKADDDVANQLLRGNAPEYAGGFNDGLPQPPPLPAAKQEQGYASTSFDILSDFDPGPMGQFGVTPAMREAGDLDRIVPKSILAMDGTKVGISGYMIPVDFENNSVQTFVLCRWQPGCCFGHVPGAHEQVYVTMPAGKGTRFVIIPVTVYGTFKIGRDITDAGGALSLYRITADKVLIPEDW